MDAWDPMESWELVLPPSRPSQQHLAWFREHLTTLGPDASVAILGSTPELRDMVARLGFQHISVLERNAGFLHKMNKLRVTQTRESVIVGDWMQTLPTCIAHFDAIISDLTSGNIPYTQRRQFYSLITDALRPGGMFCDKFLSHPIPHERLDGLLNRYEDAPLNLDTINRFNCEVFFCSELLSVFGRVETRGFYEYLHTLELGPTVRAILRSLPRITPPGMSWDYGRPWHVLKETFDPRLRCADDRVEGGDSPYAHRLRCLRWNRPGCAR